MNLLDYMNQGTTSINHLLFDNYPLIEVTDGEFLLWLQLYREQASGVLLPDFEVIAKRMKIEESIVIGRLNDMYKKGLLTIGEKNGQECLDLTPFILKIQEVLDKQDLASNTTSALKHLQKSFEGALGRLLNPFELEKLQEWVDVDKYKPEVVLLALKEAVLNDVRKFAYVDRILKTWHDAQLTTKEAVLAEQKKREIIKRQREAEREYDGGRR